MKCNSPDPWNQESQVIQSTINQWVISYNNITEAPQFNIVHSFMVQSGHWYGNIQHSTLTKYIDYDIKHTYIHMWFYNKLYNMINIPFLLHQP